MVTWIVLHSNFLLLFLLLLLFGSEKTPPQAYAGLQVGSARAGERVSGSWSEWGSWQELGQHNAHSFTACSSHS